MFSKCIPKVNEMAQNMQYEISQIIRQIIGLTILRFVRRPISKEYEERNETMFRKILLRQLEPQEARQFLKELEQKYPENERQECHGKRFAKFLEKKGTTPTYDIDYEDYKTAEFRIDYDSNIR